MPPPYNYILCLDACSYVLYAYAKSINSSDASRAKTSCTYSLGMDDCYIAGGSGADGWRSIGPLDPKSRRLPCLHSNHLLSQCPDSVGRTLFLPPPSTQQNC